jgi:hypothetical protein
MQFVFFQQEPLIEQTFKQKISKHKKKIHEDFSKCKIHQKPFSKNKISKTIKHCHFHLL